MSDKSKLYTFEHNITAGGAGEKLELSHKHTITAIEESIRRLSPLWDVRDYIAVNPIFEYKDMAFLEAIKKVKSITGVTLLPSKSFFSKKMSLSEISHEDLNSSLSLFQQDASLNVFKHSSSITSLIGFLNTKDISDERLGFTCISDQLEGEQTLKLTKEVSKWACAYFDEGQAQWSMPNKDKPFFLAWKELCVYDKNIPKLKYIVHDLPDDSMLAIEKMLTRLTNVNVDNLTLYFSRLLASVNGWSSYIKRFEFEHGIGIQHQQLAHKVVDLLAVRMAYDVALLSDGETFELQNSEQKLTSEELQDIYYRYIWMQAYELSLHKKLIQSLNNKPKSIKTTALAQMVFCIDVRSEVIRRHIETQSDKVETKGFAGFFGAPIAVKPYGAQGSDSHCPVLIKPTHEVSEVYEYSSSHTPRDLRPLFAKFYGLKNIQTSTNSCFSVAETFGFGFILKMLGSVLGKYSPNIKLNQKNKKSKFDTSNMQLSEKVALAANSLTNMGFNNNYSKYVIFVGHASESTNNPYQSALDCGACAGHSGHSNSKFLAQILNDQNVREELKNMKINIPEQTLFVSGWHNTTSDRLTFDFPNYLCEMEIDELKNIAYKATQGAQKERANHLSIDVNDLSHEFNLRAQDWSEIRPEWGLARNHSFIVANRELTKNVNLSGRSFLHDYDKNDDMDLSKLELIMTAPMIVTHWINMQYYASTIDPIKFGAGNKTLNNVVGTIGCVEGNEGDLLTGLTEQSVRYKNEYFHEPIRLQVIIDASPENIDRIISKHQMLSDLIHNKWIHLTAIDSISGKSKYKTQNGWVELEEELWN